jgi:hypothetical protein
VTRRALTLGLPLIALVASGGCSRTADVEKVPVGTEVQLTKQDGGLVEGTVAGRSDKALNVKVGGATRAVPRDQIADVRVVDRSKPVLLPPKAKFREYTIPDNTTLVVRLETPVASDKSHVEDVVTGTLTQAVRVGGVDVLPVGSTVRGVVTLAEPAGKVKGRAKLSLRFRSLSVPESEERYTIAAHEGWIAPKTTGTDAARVAIPTAGGAIVGAIAGGGKGAAIGSVIGAGAGTAIVLSTSGDDIALPRGTVLRLELEQPVDVKVPIQR